MEHSFDVEIAEKYGILEAILLNNLKFWIAKNEANNVHFYDGTYWTYNSSRAFSELFPYASQRQIQNALKKLKDEEIIQTGNYNNSAYDRTLWYAFTKKGKCIMQKCKMEDAKKGNGLVENVEPIPYIKPNNNTYNNIIDYLNKKANTSYKSTTKTTQNHINARTKEGFTEEDFKIVIDSKVAEWSKDEKMKQYLRPETLFGTKFESYLQNAKTNNYIDENVKQEYPENEEEYFSSTELTNEQYAQLMRGEITNEQAIQLIKENREKCMMRNLKK